MSATKQKKERTRERGNEGTNERTTERTNCTSKTRHSLTTRSVEVWLHNLAQSPVLWHGVIHNDPVKETHGLCLSPKDPGRQSVVMALKNTRGRVCFAASVQGRWYQSGASVPPNASATFPWRRDTSTQLPYAGWQPFRREQSDVELLQRPSTTIKPATTHPARRGNKPSTSVHARCVMLCYMRCLNQLREQHRTEDQHRPGKTRHEHDCCGRSCCG